MYKNIEKSQILTLSQQVSYQKGQVVSKTLVQNSCISITLFSFDANEEISSHCSNGDALLTCIDGQATVYIDEKEYTLKNGESIVMPANHPHSLLAKQQFKVLLIVSF